VARIIESLRAFVASANVQTILVVWCAVILEKFITISSSIDPLSFFRFVCQQMANKVRKKEYSSKQLLISGSLALCVLILPLLAITYLLLEFASYQWLLDTLLLWVLLQYTQDVHYMMKGLTALEAGKTQLSKSLIQQKMLRDTSPLSSLGLTKAALECAFLRYHHQLFTTILCYLTLGPIATLGYRLCYEAHHVWNVKLSSFTMFGRLANTITFLVQLLPSLILSVSFIVVSRISTLINVMLQKTIWALIRDALLKQNILSLLLFSLSQGVSTNTGGPVMYAQKKYNRPRFTPPISKEPNAGSLKVLISLLNRHLIVCLLIITWFIFCFYPQ
jgi:adenosylcobinamide-phosphate synthase